MHEAFFFGPDDRQIFGIYHPALGMDSGVLSVICPPLLSELNRAHSSLRKVAVALAEKGQHVLRMDFSGMGDSHGRIADTRLSDWIEDVRLTIQEGIEITGCRTVRVLAVRASALVVCKAVGKMPEVERLVLWDPIPDGPAYLKELDREQFSAMDTHHYLRLSERSDLMRRYSIYELSDELLKDLGSIESSAYAEIPSKMFRIVRTLSTDRFPIGDVAEKMVAVDCGWATQIDGVILAKPIIEKMFEGLTEG